MSELEMKSKELAQEALVEALDLLFKASNKAKTKSEIEKLKKQRKKIIRELDRVDIAKLNDMLLPEEVKEAIKSLDTLANELKEEKKRIKETTERLKKADEYIGYAMKAIEFV